MHALLDEMDIRECFEYPGYELRHRGSNQETDRDLRGNGDRPANLVTLSREFRLQGN